MALQPLALSLLGVEPAPRRRRGDRGGDQTESDGQNTYARPARASRRATSYYNPFQTTCTTSNDSPPSFAIATKQRPVQRRHTDGGREVLPKYTCTAAVEGKALLNIEAVSPLHPVAPSEWREVYLVLRGTLLSFHKPKDNGAGRLLRSYTLQHAEIGLAPDVQHVTLEPRTKLAHMIPSAARRRAWMKDPHMFEPVRQHSMRLRLETDQIVLASPDEERIHSFIHAISSGIDVSCSIDERSIPRQCTVPRRRRRHRQQQQPHANLQDPALLAEQERILRDMYPGFAEESDRPQRLELGRTITTITSGSGTSTRNNDPPLTPMREEDEIDLAAIREEAEEEENPHQTPPSRHPLRPTYHRSTTDASVLTTYSASDLIFATSPDNFNLITGKWQPPHTRTPQQVQRYIKRCMPMLLAESTRASDILICNGKRVRVNLRMEMLEEWELTPPSYKSHGFGKALVWDAGPEGSQGVEEVESGDGEVAGERPRSVSQTSVAGAESGAQASTSMLGVEGEDRIERAENEVESGMANLELTKVVSITGAEKTVPKAPESPKRQERRSGDDIHGVIFCF